jgi:hypothetical protein
MAPFCELLQGKGGLVAGGIMGCGKQLVHFSCRFFRAYFFCVDSVGRRKETRFCNDGLVFMETAK